MIKELDALFIKRYTKFFEDLNKNVYVLNKSDKGTYMIPAVKVGSGGMIKLPVNVDVIKLPDPAVISTEVVEVLADQRVYRLAIPVSEVEVMLKNEFYFNHFFDSVLNSALNNMAAEIGKPDTLKWGTAYITFRIPGSTGVFRDMVVASATDDYYELRLISDLASNTPVQKYE